MIFDEQISRKPDHYPFANEMIDAMWAGHWTPNEFTFTSDLQNYKVDFNDKEREVIKNALSAIGQIEVAVKTYWARLGNTLRHPSLSDLGIVMAQIEVIHGRAYERLLDVLELQDTFQENLKLDIIRGRVNYLRKYLDKNYTDDKKQFVYSLILFTLFVENVSLFSQFYVVLWFNRFRNSLKDAAQQIDYTKREELLHAQAGTKLIQIIRSEYPYLFDDELEARIVQEAQEAFKAESKIVDWMLGDYTGENLNKAVLKEYIKGRINESLVGIGFKTPFVLNEVLIEQTRWMDEDVLGTNMTDFFHKRPTDYAKSHTSFDEAAIFG